jgi:hypothetical protein
VPFYLLIQGHDRNFCDRMIERTVGSNTFTMTYPFWGEAGQVVTLSVETNLREDSTPTFAIYNSLPQDGELVKGATVLVASDGEPLEFRVPENSAYFVEVQVQPDSPFLLKSTCP